MATQTMSKTNWCNSLFNTMPNTYYDLYDKSGKIAVNVTLEQVQEANLLEPPKIIKPKIIEIVCNTLTGARIVIYVDETNSIFNLKKLIYKKTDIMLDDQRLVYNGTVLDDMKTIQSHNIKNGDSINLVCRLRGGMFHSTSSRGDFDSLNFIIKFQKGSKMIHGLKQYNIHMDTLNELEQRLQQCETDEQIDKIYSLIEGVYVA